jgi:hypothetical protein
MINRGNVATAEPALREVQKAARALGLQTQIFNASTGPATSYRCSAARRRHGRWALALDGYEYSLAAFRQG